MLPNSKIVVFKNGNSKIIGKEKTNDCYELSNLGRDAGRVTKDEDRDHVPVHQDVHNSERG